VQCGPQPGHILRREHPHPWPGQTPPPPWLREDPSRLQAMVLGLGDSELAADITGEQQPLRADHRVEAAERVRVMTVDVAGNALGGTPVLGLELDLLTASTGAQRCH